MRIYEITRGGGVEKAKVHIMGELPLELEMIMSQCVLSVGQKNSVDNSLALSIIAVSKVGKKNSKEVKTKAHLKK